MDPARPSAQSQLADLQKLRATLELVKQAASSIYKDLQQIHTNNSEVLVSAEKVKQTIE